MTFWHNKRRRLVMISLPTTLNGFLILFGVFILFSMAIVWIIFEEFTAFTDNTQQWIEFNFYIFYWDKLTISRVYLSFITIYGAILVGIGAMQIHGIRKKNLSFLHLAPLLLVLVALITVLGAISWLIVTAVNYNEGFLATGGFIFERMRFKGNVWKDLIYREQSFKYVTHGIVPRKSPILKIWVFQRQRDFSCCGWDSYLDYAIGNYTNLPESCCQQTKRVYGCADNFLSKDRDKLLQVINYKGCREIMYDWYRSGFIENIIMSIIGLGVGAFLFYLYSLNRREYYRVLDDYDDLRKPMMNATMSMSTINSKASASHMMGTGHIVNFGQKPSSQSYTHVPMQRLVNQNHTPSIGGENIYAGGSIGDGNNQLPLVNNEFGNTNNPLQALQNMQNGSVRFPFRGGRSNANFNSTPSDRVLIEDE